jgi:RNA polymerase sigma factor (sigma-70 family)
LQVKELLAQAKQGDKKAEEEIFRFLYERFAFIAKYRLGREEARDISQDACMTILEKFRAEKMPENFEAWSYGVLRMKIGNFLQKREVRQKVMVDEIHIGGAAEQADVPPNPELKRKLLDCLRKIVRAYPRYARAMNLVHQGYKTNEICDRMGLNAGNLYVILNRGRSMLSRCLNKGGIE